MKFLSVLIKPASSLCNLRCRYCFYVRCEQAEGADVLWSDDERGDEAFN